MRTNYFFVVFLVFISQYSIGQDKKILKAQRITTAPKIDGVIDDEIWKSLPKYSDFYMLEPSNEGLAQENVQTTVQLAYDNKAVYISAFMADNDASKIPTQFSQRDDINAQADIFMVGLNTYNDGINETRFWVTSAGTIADSRLSQNNEDFGFDIVFECRTTRDEKGWYAEFKIPYNALRFPEVDVQDWSVNFIRRLRRQNETHSWNRINQSVGQESQYNGIIQGVRDIKPPTRLTFFPFIQASTSTFDGDSTNEISGGLDIKYGLSDSFTLDAQLIPDFGQVAFDNVSLNLGPFEQTFGENRAFFTEGVELFRKGNIFFSRRIGGAPSGEVTLDDNEEELLTPTKVNLINSVKISGRTKNNLGVGFLNSISEATYATIENVLDGSTRRELVEPLTNYNIIVLDQQFNQNSSVSLINTSVIRSGSDFRDANVTAAVFDLSNKENSFNLSGRAVVSSLSEQDSKNQLGFRSEIDLRRTKGKFRYRIGHDFANTTYDINDLGLNFTNNFNSFTAGTSYQIFEPTKRFNFYRYEFTARHRRLYKPDVHTRTSFNLNTVYVLKNRFAFGYGAQYTTENNDFFEARVDDRFVIFDPNLDVNAFISSDYRKKLALDVRLSARTYFNENDNQQEWKSILISPRYRFSDKLFMILSSEYSERNNNFGYVDDDGVDVFLGNRDITSLENTISLAYNFDPFKVIDLQFRNFWSTADYSSNEFYVLNQDGTRSSIEYDFDERADPRTNFNIWNLDLSFRWRFAPGSEASLLYRNQIFNEDNQATLDYNESLGNLFDEPVQHTVSLRVTYFIDYNNVKGLFKKQTSDL